MLIDSVSIEVSAGKGGAGAVAFSKIKMSLGPTGGSGGRGGNVYLEAVSDLGALRRFRTTKKFSAENGRDGRGAFRDGNNGEDTTLLVPRGTVVSNLATGIVSELTSIGERLLVAKGGNGGKGNFHYRSSINTTPKQSQPGLQGEVFALKLDLKLIADIGFVGFPNTGKSSLLNELTNANSKVANYPFTTLEPNLGVYENLILADIPGLIDGASYGKGLGIRFLRHIERTRIIFHFIDSGSQNPIVDYKTIRKELGAYNPLLLEKDEYILLTKTDTVGEDSLAKTIKSLAQLKNVKKIISISIYDYDRMLTLRRLLDKVSEKTVAIPETIKESKGGK
ncbi:MAG: GTPase ObgE [Patescibacteria group bacterium]